jgi:hypothetical protein
MQSLNETPSKGVKDSKDVPKGLQGLRVFCIIILHQAFLHHIIMHHTIIHHIISHQPQNEKKGNCSLLCAARVKRREQNYVFL